MIRLSPKQIEDWVARYFPAYKRKSKGRQLVINNPFDGDTGGHFWIGTYISAPKKHPTLKNYYVNDFRPGKGKYCSSFMNFVRRYLNCTYHEATVSVCGNDKQRLQDYIRESRSKIEEEEEDEIETDPEKEIDLPLMSKPFTSEELPRCRSMALAYLRTRCVTEEMAVKLHLHFTPTTIVFPYIEYGSIVFWQEREVNNKRFNFPNEETTGLQKTDYLYNFDGIEPCDYVAVVESIFNCISLGENCGASGGAIIVGKQIKKLEVLSPNLVVLGPDNDIAGIRSLADNYWALHKKFKLAYSIPPDGVKDWNQMDQDSGAGTARAYFDKNISYLTLVTVEKLMSKYNIT